jgi:hypothetical protein
MHNASHHPFQRNPGAQITGNLKKDGWTTDFSDGTDGDLSEAGSGIPAEQAGYRVLPGRTFILLLIVILLLILISLSGGVSLSNQDGADWCVGRG